MKTLFDVELSLKQSPPMYPAGVRLVKRVVLKRKDVSYRKQDNPRVHNIIAEDLPPLRDSLIVNGWEH